MASRGGEDELYTTLTTPLHRHIEIIGENGVYYFD